MRRKFLYLCAGKLGDSLGKSKEHTSIKDTHFNGPETVLEIGTQLENKTLGDGEVRREFRLRNRSMVGGEMD